MSLPQVEGLFIGLKEGIKILFILYLLYVFLSGKRREGLFYAVTTGLFIVFLLSTPYVTEMVGSGAEARGFIIRLTGYSFGIFYLLSLILLYHHSAGDIFGLPWRYLVRSIFLFPFTLALTILYFLPDIAGTVLYMKDLIRLKEGYSPAVLFAVGIMISMPFLFLLRKSIADMTNRLFDLPQIFVFLSLVKLLAGGIKGYAEFSLIPTVQSGITKLIHDMVHQTFVTIMVPDHMILKVTTWNFIAIFFSDRFAFYVSLLFLFVPLLIFMIHYIQAPVIPPSDIPSSAERRRYIKRVRDVRFLKGLPVIFFLLIILLMWLSQGEERVTSLYNPEPEPIIAEAGEVVIPIKSPAGDLRDGAIHKFALDLDGETVRILVMGKRDGSLAVCLDACEICPPEGYAQSEGHVVCLYCGTPIPFDTLGRPGGCNPIPLRATIADNNIRVRIDEIRKRWQMVSSGRTKEILE